MDWNTWLRLPDHWLGMLAALPAVLALLQLARLRRSLRARRRLAALWHAAACLLAFTLALGLGAGALSLRGYRVLAEESPVLEIDARILSPQRWALTLTWPDGATREVEVAGDAWRVEAVVLKWRLPALAAGAPPLYRLDRIDGRYDDPAQEASAPRLVTSFERAGRFDVVQLKRQYPAWLGLVDTVFGSGAFLPLVDGGHYSVRLMRSGALVARADAATTARIDGGW